MDFPSNSREPRASKVEKPDKDPVLKVVEGRVVRRKKPLGKRFSEIFFGGDTKGVVEYIVNDVLIPAAKDTITDAVSQGIERMIFGESRSGGRRPSSRQGAFGGGSSSINYSRYATSGRRDETTRPPMSRRARGSHDFDEIILASRAEADDVIEQLFDVLEKYDQVSVKDLYELVGENYHHTDEKWGWTNLRGAGVTRTGGGYLLNLPKTEPLD